MSQVDGKEWLRTFRLDNIKRLEILNEYFNPPENINTILHESVNVWFSEKKDKKVVLKIDKEAAGFFKQRVYFPFQKIKKENRDGSLKDRNKNLSI